MVAPPCNHPYAACFCALDRGHESPHECSCGGSWECGHPDCKDDHLHRVVRLPGMFGGAFDGLLG